MRSCDCLAKKAGRGRYAPAPTSPIFSFFETLLRYNKDRVRARRHNDFGDEIPSGTCAFALAKG